VEGKRWSAFVMDVGYSFVVGICSLVHSSIEIAIEILIFKFSFRNYSRRICDLKCMIGDFVHDSNS